MLLCLIFRKAAIGDFGIGKNHRRNRAGIIKSILVARCNRRGHLAFVKRLVREHHAADNVADGQDGGIVCLHARVDLHKTAVVEFGLGIVEAEFVRIGATPDGYQNAVKSFVKLFVVGGFEVDLDALFLGFDFFDGGFQVNVFEVLLDLSRQGLDEVGISRRKQLVHHLDHGYLGAEALIDLAEFEADIAATNDEQTLGNVRQIQCLTRTHDAVVVHLKHLGHGRYGPGGEDAFFELDGFGRILVSALDLGKLDGIGIGECAAGLDKLHLARLGQAHEALGEFFDHAVFPVAEFVNVELGVGKPQPHVAGVLGLDHELARLQKGLRRNAAAKEANPARTRLLIHERHVHTEIRRVKCRHVTTRPST